MSDSDLPALAVTGAGGWIGSRLVSRARGHGVTVQRIDARRDLWRQFDYPQVRGASVIHLAAITPKNTAAHPQDVQRVNQELPLEIAYCAARAGARRLVFVSSAKVMGETASKPWVESDAPIPAGDLAASKWQAEQGLRAASATLPLEIVIVRPPLVYGPGVRSNFLRLLRLAASPWPIPVSTSEHPRSMIYLDNLADALCFLALREEPTTGTYFVRDDREWATRELIRYLRRCLRRHAPIVGLPHERLRKLFVMFDKMPEFTRLFESARVDDQAIRALGWKPAKSSETALQLTSRWLVDLNVAMRRWL